MNEQLLKSYFETALILADMGKVKRLFASLGIRDYQKITPEECIKALDAHGFKFSQPFGQLAKNALVTPKVESFIKARKMDRVTGVTVPGTLPTPGVTPIAGVGTTNNNKNANGVAWFNSISNFLIGGVDSASSLINTLKGRDVIMAEAALEQQKATTAANTKKTNWTAIFGIGGALAFIGAIVFILKRKR